MFLNLENLHNPYMMEADERAALRSRYTRTPWWRSRCFNIIVLSFTLTGFLLFLTTALYFMLLERTEYIFFLVTAIICLAVFVHSVTTDGPFLTPPRPLRAIPVQLTTAYRIKSLLRSQSGKASSSVPERSDSTHSLPAYILIPAEQEETDESSRASTESTLSAESCQETQPEDSSGLPTAVSQLPVTDGSSAAIKLSDEAVAMISQIVKDSLVEKDGSSPVETISIEKSSDNSSENSEASREGVRQRKQSPMETQQHISLPEGGKNE